MFGIDSLVRFDWRLAVGGAELSEEEFRQLAESKRRLVQINGQWILLDPAMFMQIHKLMDQVGKRNGLSFREVLELHLLDGETVGEISGTGMDTPEASQPWRRESIR